MIDIQQRRSGRARTHPQQHLLALATACLHQSAVLLRLATLLLLHRAQQLAVVPLPLNLSNLQR
jgi:hypothetical protein